MASGPILKRLRKSQGNQPTVDQPSAKRKMDGNTSTSTSRNTSRSVMQLQLSGSASRIVPDPSNLDENPTTPTTQHIVASRADSQEDDDVNDNASVAKVGRGVNRCLKLNKLVEDHGKIKISFNAFEREPDKNAKEFSEAIGFTIRTVAELENVSEWRQVPEENKNICRKNLLTWFDIEDLSSERVKRIIEGKLRTSYRNWRNTLKECYDNLVKKELDPRESPRPEVKIDKWLAVCNWLESDVFQKKSSTNKINREKIPFNHTAGKTSYVSKYKEMTNKSKIELFKSTHVDKSGNFVNSSAQQAYNKMIELEKAAPEEGEASMTEDQILETTLGRRSGYQKGMGYGVEVPRGSNSLSSTQQGSQLSDKLSETQATLDETRSKLDETQTALENAQGEISTLSEQLEEQKEKNKSNEDKLDVLMSQFQKMQQDMLKMQGRTSNLS